MRLSKARELYELCLLKSFDAVPVPDGWILVVQAKIEHRFGSTLETAQGAEKLYMTLDSLNNDVTRIQGSRQSWTTKI